MEMFALEMRTRKVIHEILSPMLDKMNVERQKMAVMTDRNHVLEDRVTQLEHVCDVAGNRPKVFQLIKNEFAEVKEQQVTIENKLALRIEKTGLRLDGMQDEIDKFDNLAKMLT